MYDSGWTVKLMISILKLSYKERFKRINERSIVIARKRDDISQKKKICVILYNYYMKMWKI